MRKLLLLALALLLAACSSGPEKTDKPAPNVLPKWFGAYSPQPGTESPEQRITIETSTDPSKINFGIVQVEDLTYGADLSPHIAIETVRSEEGVYKVTIRNKDGGNLFPVGSEIKVTVDGYAWTFKSIAQ